MILSATAAGAATLVHFREVARAGRRRSDDLVIAGGRVIDPSRKFDAVADVAIAGGQDCGRQTPVWRRRAAADDRRARQAGRAWPHRHPHARAAARRTIRGLCSGRRRDVARRRGLAGRRSDRRGRRRGESGAEPDAACSSTSAKKRHHPRRRSDGSRPTSTSAATRAAIERHRDVVVGIKARLSKNVAGKNDLEALRRAQAVRRPLRVPIMIHMGQTVSSLPRHPRRCSSRATSSRTSTRRRPTASSTRRANCCLRVADARKRGIWFDFGNGRVDHFTWDDRRARDG